MHKIDKSYTDLFIRRPVFALVLSLIILLVGLQSYRLLNVRQFPKIDTSVITITTTYRGASAKLMEGFVSTPIESAVSGLDGLDYVSANNTQGQSQISIYLREGTNVDTALTDVSNKVASIRGKLPKEIDDPIIMKVDQNANPTLFIAFPSKVLTPEDITDFLVRAIKPEIEAIDGVGSAVIYGEKQYAMRIWLDPTLMAAHNVTANDVVNVLRRNNLQTAAGRVQSKMIEINLAAKTDLNTPEQFNQLVVKEDNNHLLRIQDIGYAELGSKDIRTSTVLNGQPTVVMGIVPKSTANPIDIAKVIKAMMPRIQRELPVDMKAEIVWDSSKFISESIHEVYKTIAEACAFVILVIFLFLGSVRAVFIPAVTIPLSIFGVCFVMLAMGFTLNTITLLAWVLAIGMVVDDAIVVLENIHRHMEEGLTPLKAAIKGAREIRFAVISMTLTLAAVYAPIGFMGGLVGTLFREFAFALAGAVIVSGIIALTLTPMLCSKILVLHPKEHSLANTIDAISNHLRDRYRVLLKKVIAHRNIVLSVVAIVFGLCFWLWSTTSQELAPTEDQGAIMGIFIGPTTANLKYTEKYSKEIQQAYNTIPERDNFVLINGYGANGADVTSGISFLILKPWSERKRSQSQIRADLFPKMWMIPGFMAFPVEMPSLPGAVGNTPVEFIMETTAEYEELNKAVQKMMEVVRTNPRLLNPDISLKLNKPEVKIMLDRDKAADMGISMEEIGGELTSMLAEPAITQFEIRGRSYDVIPQIMEQYRQNPEQLKNLYVRTRNNQLIPLSNIAEITIKAVPQSLMHFQQMRAAKLTASLAPGYTLGEALTFLSQAARDVLPKNISFDYSGQSRQFINASGALMKTFIFAIVFIYLVLAAQFESFRDPLIVMFTVPMSILGALITLRLTHGTMNIYTQIGLITLVGLITKHGILIVEFANQLQIQGKSMTNAITEAAATRLRPILMTTGAMILGALPLAFASGAGAASRAQIGWVIVGGMSFGTLLTLFVLPVIYLLLAGNKKAVDESKFALE